MDDPRSPTSPPDEAPPQGRFFDWAPETPPPPALAAFLLRADTPTGLASFVTAETVLPRGVAAQLAAALALGHLVPTEAGRRFMAAMRGER